MIAITEVHLCPTCGGTGAVIEPLPHDHEFRLVQSYGGPSFNLQVYACQIEGCEASLCFDCARDGLSICGGES